MMKILAVIFVCLAPAGIVSAAAAFAPWMDVMQMADHFSKSNFSGDGFLSFEACRNGMQMAGYSDEDVMHQFRDVRNFMCKPIHQSITTKRSATIIGSHSQASALVLRATGTVTILWHTKYNVWTKPGSP